MLVSGRYILYVWDGEAEIGGVARWRGRVQDNGEVLAWERDRFQLDHPLLIIGATMNRLNGKST